MLQCVVRKPPNTNIQHEMKGGASGLTEVVLLNKGEHGIVTLPSSSHSFLLHVHLWARAHVCHGVCACAHVCGCVCVCVEYIVTILRCIIDRRCHYTSRSTVSSTPPIVLHRHASSSMHSLTPPHLYGIHTLFPFRLVLREKEILPCLSHEFSIFDTGCDCSTCTATSLTGSAVRYPCLIVFVIGFALVHAPCSSRLRCGTGA
jgi:hypothetical protein